MFEGAIAVDGRNMVRLVRDLGFKCNDKEIPDPVDDIKPTGWWLADAAHFTGNAHWRDRHNVRYGMAHHEATGPIMIMLAAGRLMAILSPIATTIPAVWIAAPAATLGVTTDATAPARRPEHITITGPDWVLHISTVARLYRHTNRFHEKEEGSFLKALATTASEPPYSPTAETAAQNLQTPNLDDRTRWTWVQDDALPGLFRQHIDGTPTQATWLYDRRLPRGAQMEAIAALDWPPPAELAETFTYAEHGTLPDPRTDQLPEGRAHHPFNRWHTGALLDVDAGEATHPVYRQLWPSLSSAGALSLDPGEAISFSWGTPPPRFRSYNEGKLLKGTTQPPSNLLESGAHLSSQRLIIAGPLKPPPGMVREDYSLGLSMISPTLDTLRASIRQVRRWRGRANLAWAVHLRYEFISEVGFYREVSEQAGHRSFDLIAFFVKAKVFDNGETEITLPLTSPGAPAADELITRICDLILAADPTRTVVAQESHARAHDYGQGRTGAITTTGYTISSPILRSLPDPLVQNRGQ